MQAAAERLENDTHTYTSTRPDWLLGLRAEAFSRVMSNTVALPKPGDTLAEAYRVECQLGSGRSGAVFGAIALDSGKRYALRCLLSRDAATLAAATKRFLRRAHEAELFQHRNVVEVYAVEESQGTFFSVTEWLDGTTLERYLQRHGTLALADALQLLVPCMDALAIAHEAGIVHGDLRPSNFFLCRATKYERDRARLMNFGFGTWADHPVMLQRSATWPMQQYISPEELQGEALCERTDIYAFGVLLYRVLTGALPFNAANATELEAEIIAGRFTPISRRAQHIPREIAEVVERAIGAAPNQRFASLRDMMNVLARHVALPVGTAAPTPPTAPTSKARPRTPLTQQVSPLASTKPATTGSMQQQQQPRRPQPMAAVVRPQSTHTVQIGSTVPVAPQMPAPATVEIAPPNPPKEGVRRAAKTIEIAPLKPATAPVQRGSVQAQRSIALGGEARNGETRAPQPARVAAPRPSAPRAARPAQQTALLEHKVVPRAEEPAAKPVQGKPFVQSYANESQAQQRARQSSLQAHEAALIALEISTGAEQARAAARASEASQPATTADDGAAQRMTNPWGVKPVTTPASATSAPATLASSELLHWAVAAPDQQEDPEDEDWVQVAEPELQLPRAPEAVAAQSAATQQRPSSVPPPPPPARGNNANATSATQTAHAHPKTTGLAEPRRPTAPPPLRPTQPTAPPPAAYGRPTQPTAPPPAAYDRPTQERMNPRVRATTGEINRNRFTNVTGPLPRESTLQALRRKLLPAATVVLSVGLLTRWAFLATQELTAQSTTPDVGNLAGEELLPGPPPSAASATTTTTAAAATEAPEQHAATPQQPTTAAAPLAANAASMPKSRPSAQATPTPAPAAPMAAAPAKPSAAPKHNELRTPPPSAAAVKTPPAEAPAAPRLAVTPIQPNTFANAQPQAAQPKVGPSERKPRPLSQQDPWATGNAAFPVLSPSSAPAPTTTAPKPAPAPAAPKAKGDPLDAMQLAD
ncbi:MAG: hypothetical protein RL701_644 [Pseudomonadota bacterium]